MDVTDSLVLDVPMKLSLELMPIVSSDLLYTERKFLNDVVYKVDCIGLGVPLIDFQCPYASCIIDRGVLVPLDLFYRLFL